MTVVKMKKTISRPRNKNDKERQKDISAFFDASVHMEHMARDFAQHIEDFGMDFLASEWAKFHQAQGELSQTFNRLKQEKVGNKWGEDITHQHFYDD